jgi:hypothetical protein
VDTPSGTSAAGGMKQWALVRPTVYLSIPASASLDPRASGCRGTAPAEEEGGRREDKDVRREEPAAWARGKGTEGSRPQCQGRRGRHGRDAGEGSGAEDRLRQPA